MGHHQVLSGDTESGNTTKQVGEEGEKSKSDGGKGERSSWLYIQTDMRTCQKKKIQSCWAFVMSSWFPPQWRSVKKRQIESAPHESRGAMLLSSSFSSSASSVSYPLCYRRWVPTLCPFVIHNFFFISLCFVWLILFLLLLLSHSHFVEGRHMTDRRHTYTHTHTQSTLRCSFSFF